MEIEVSINGKQTKITLTKDQVEKVQNQHKDWRSVVDFASACELLGLNAQKLVDKWTRADLTAYQINSLMLELCISVINEHEDIVWDGRSNYRPWFEKKTSGWVPYGVYDYFTDSSVGSTFYYTTREKAEHGQKHLMNLYSTWLG